jgi:ParB-like chromosome segregation protein Spo0J
MEQQPLMQIQTRLISQLVPDPQNARAHDQQNIDAIAASLNNFGQQKPVVITGENVILAGNGTVTAAKQLGWTEIQVNVAPKTWSYETARAYSLADNRTGELSTWDTDILASHLVDLDAEGWDVSDFGFPELTPPLDPGEREPKPPKVTVCPNCYHEF